MGKQHESSGSKGLGLSLDVQIGNLKDTVSELSNALQQTTDKAGDRLSDLVNRVYEQARQIKQSREEGEESSESQRAYEKAVHTLKNAADKGQKDAASALKRLGERIDPDQDKGGSSRKH